MHINFTRADKEQTTHVERLVVEDLRAVRVEVDGLGAEGEPQRVPHPLEHLAEPQVRGRHDQVQSLGDIIYRHIDLFIRSFGRLQFLKVWSVSGQCSRRGAPGGGDMT